jgi:hypothetical protein
MHLPVNLQIAIYAAKDRSTPTSLLDEKHCIGYRAVMTTDSRIVVTDSLKFSADVYGEYSSHTIHTTLTIPTSEEDMASYEELVEGYYDRANWWMQTAANRLFAWQKREPLFNLGDQPEVRVPALVTQSKELESVAMLEVGSDMVISQNIHGTFSSHTLGLKLRGPLSSKQLAGFDKVADRIFDRIQLTLMKKMNQVFEARGKERFFEVES